MRITNRMMTTKYIRSLNSISGDLNKLNNKVSSGRAFTRASENTSGAIRAFQIRRDLSRTTGYEANIQHAETTLANSESAITHMEELMQEAQAKILQGQNGTQSENERKIIATELRSIQEQMLQTLNSSSADMYLFGGTSIDTKPFTVDDVTGKLQYNGEVLSSLVPTDQTTIDLESDSRYVDIGLQVKLDGTGNVDPNSVFQYSIPGLKIAGYGQTTINGNPVSNNLYELIGEIATEFEKINFDSSKSGALFGHLQHQAPKIVHALTEVGAKTSYLEFMTNRLESKTLNDQERQMTIEAADPAETIIHFKSQEAAYNAALQMGTKIIQPSIFDYMS